jgi:WASH complex subunit 7|tara:strand:+ start:3934 stop:4563 length:630 start_codon:yes stop_codon:yes gene_type:complete
MMHSFAQEAKFVPGLKTSSCAFEAAAKSDEMSTSTTEAAKTLDSKLELLQKQTAESVNFFKTLVDVFAGKLDDTNEEHLKHFYLMIPPLSLHAVESMVSGREKFMQRVKESHAADDGFALGVAFLLRVLDQGTDFDSLNWRNTSVGFYTDEKAKQTAMNKDDNARSSSDDDASDDESNTVRLGKFQVLVDEFALLHFCLESARTFLTHS